MERPTQLERSGSLWYSVNVEYQDAMCATLQSVLPDLQAVYLFGSWADGTARSDSDLDLGVLLPHLRAKEAGSFAMSDLQARLEAVAGRKVDLINLRLVSTVFRKVIITTGLPIHVADQRALQEFEMITLSLYQKLNEERAEILRSVRQDGRAYAV